VNKKILVTGAAGLVGKVLIEKLRRLDYEVLATDITTDPVLGIEKLDVTEQFKVYDAITWADVVIHLAALVGGKPSEKSPWQYTYVNFLGTLNVLEAIREINPDIKLIFMSSWATFGTDIELPITEGTPQNPKNPYGLSKVNSERLIRLYTELYGMKAIVFRPCYSEDTRLFTIDGFKPYNEVKIGDLVWTQREENGKLELQPIQDIQIYDYSGSMIQLNNRQVNLLVTPDHQIRYKTRHKRYSHHYEYDKAEAKTLLDVGDYYRIYLPITGIWEGADSEYIETQELINQDRLHFNAIRLPKQLRVSTLLSILGWYISEGTIDNSINIKNYDENERKEICKLFREFELSPRNDKKYNRVTVSCQPLATILKTAGCGSHKKTIPDWALKFSPRALHYLYTTLMKGDGTKSTEERTINVYSTVSNKLQHKMSELVLKLGYSPAIKTNPPRGITYINDQKIESNSPLHLVKIRTQYKRGGIEGRQINELQNYSGVVWCVTVPNGNVFVERKGYITNCGNCMIYGPEQTEKNHVQQIVDCMVSEEMFEIWGSGEHTRELLHTNDMADILIRAIEYDAPKAYSPYVVGTENPLSVKATAEAGQSIVSFEIKYVPSSKWVFDQRSDMTKIKTEMGIDPIKFIDIKTGLEDCLEFRYSLSEQ